MLSAESGHSFVAFSPVPRVFSKERNKQEDEAREETGKKQYVGFDTTVLQGIEDNRHESEGPNHSADDSDEGRNSFLLTQDLLPH